MEFSASLAPWIHIPAVFLDPWDSPLRPPREPVWNQLTPQLNTSPQHWERCISNPKNLPDRNPSQPRWRIDGCSACGTQFFAHPVSLGPYITPRRMDVYIPDQAKHPSHLRALFRSGEAYYTCDNTVNELGICQFILDVLELWSSKFDVGQLFQVMPFGSRIVIENVTTPISDVRVRVLPNLDLEKQLLSIEQLQDFWCLPASVWPPSIGLTELRQEAQLHDSISTVRIPSQPGDSLYIFKSSTHSYRYIYHELKLLLTMPPHNNVMSKPVRIVTGQAASDQTTKVYGFIMEYHPRGNLKRVLTQQAQKHTLRLEDQFRWARQITSALISIRDGPAKFFSELKPDNILLTDPGDDILLIDFEQHANWDCFSAPEVRYVDNLKRLLHSSFMPDHRRAAYEDLVRPHLEEGLEKPSSETYTNPPKGYFHAWGSLTPFQQEKAMVYALGKVLWCIFEGCDHTRNTLMEEYTEPSRIEFPAFERTPERIQLLIKACTLGTDEWQGEEVEVTRIGHRFYRRGKAGTMSLDCDIAQDALQAAKEMWIRRLEQMEIYLEAKRRWDGQIATAAEISLLGFPNRPLLSEISQILLESNYAEVEKDCRLISSSLLDSQTPKPESPNSLSAFGGHSR